MAKQLLTSYTFTPGVAGAGTIVVPGTYALEQFLLVTNVAQGVVLYQFNKPSKGGTVSTASGQTTLLLDVDTSTMSAGDSLQVLVDDAGASQGMLPTGAATAANQATGNASLSSIDADLGNLNDAPAASDSGGFSVVALIKRSLQNWTSLLSRIPALGASEATLASLNAKTPNLQGDRVPVADGGLLSAARESFDFADSTLAGMVLQQDAIPDPTNPAGPALQVTLRDPVQLDQGVPAVIGGVDPTGAVQRARVGTDGGLQLTDGKTFVGTANSVGGTTTGWIDTTGYQSIVVTFFGGASATFAFQATNDPTYSIATGNAAGWSTSGINVPQVSAANPAAGTTWQFPVTARWFRIILSSYASGTAGTVVTMRSTPAPFIPSNLAVGIAQIGGITVQQGGASGVLGVGGILRPNFQLSTYNALYGNYTQTLTSQTAALSFASPVTVGGIDSTSTSRPIQVDSLGALTVSSATSNQSQQSIHELLYQILATLRAVAHYQYETAMGDKPRCVADEPDSLIGDYLNQANQFSNITN